MKATYRIVNAILAILIFVVAFFADFIYIQISTSDNLEDIISGITDDEYGGIALEETISIKRFVDIYRGDDYLSNIFKFDGDGNFYWPSEFKALNVRLVAFLASFALALIMAVFVFVWSCCSNKRLPIFIIGILGIICGIVMSVTFKSMSEDIFYNRVNIIDYVADNLLGNGILSTIVGSAASTVATVYLALAGMQNGLIIVYICISIWTAVFWLSDLGDKNVAKAKADEKAAKAEKKAAKAKKKEEKKLAKAEAKAEKAGKPEA